MRVFVTGATGFIGEAVLAELQGAGHTVTGLARNDAGAEKLKRLGAAVHRGDLTDPAGLAEAARASDGVLHLGFIHNFAEFVKSVATDAEATEAMARALEGTGKPFVYTSGLAFLVEGRPVTEEDAAPPFLRGANENLALGFAGHDVRAMVLRLSPTVHGRGDHQFLPYLIQLARQKGVSSYIGEGQNLWPAVHRNDAATLYRLALEKGRTGSRLHGVAEEGIPTRTIAEAIGEGLGLPVRSLPAEEAEGHFGWIARFFGTGMAATNATTRESLGWKPTGPGLLQDLREGGYFDAARG